MAWSAGPGERHDFVYTSAEGGGQQGGDFGKVLGGCGEVVVLGGEEVAEEGGRPVTLQDPDHIRNRIVAILRLSGGDDTQLQHIA